jgi:fumarate hydratase subunit beta
MLRISAPLDEKTISGLHAGDEVLVNGIVFGARDAVHIKLAELIRTDAKLPFDITGQIIYYVGPTPGCSGDGVGSAGPTTSSRMDFCTPSLISHGLKGMIGKGPRSRDVTEAIVKYRAVYLGAIGGIGALLGEKIVHAEVAAYGELGPEALWKFVVEDFPVIVINDMYGGDWYKEAVSRQPSAISSR